MDVVNDNLPYTMLLMFQQLAIFYYNNLICIFVLNSKLINFLYQLWQIFCICMHGQTVANIHTHT